MAPTLGHVVVSPRDAAEVAAVYDLFARSFGPDYFTAKNNFGFLMENEPYAPPDNHLLVKAANGEVLGALRYVDRHLMLGPVKLKAGGMSFFAVHPQFWTEGIAAALRGAFFERADKEFDLTFGFARKRLDGYWSRFGYIGYTSFAALRLDPSALPRGDGACRATDFSESDLPDCQRYHADNYRDVFGSIHRDDALWHYYLKKIRWHDLGALCSFKGLGDRLVGYALIKKNTVLEIAGEKGAYRGILKALNDKLGALNPTIEFNLSPAHPFFRFLLQYNHSCTIRRVWDGGHIAKTSSIPKFLARIRPVLEERLGAADCSPFSIRIRDQAFDWAGSRLHVHATQAGEPAHVEYDEGEWQKVLLGVMSPSDVKSFRAVSGQAERIVNTLFPVLWPQTPELDHF